MVQTHLEILLIKEMRKGISNSGIYGCAVVWKNKISTDEDLLINTLKGYETSVKQGEKELSFTITTIMSRPKIGFA
jgi:hypothetical protein